MSSAAPADHVTLSVPAHLAPQLQAIIDHATEFVDSRGIKRSFAESEHDLMALTAKLETACLCSMLEALDCDAPRIQVGDQTYRKLNQEAPCRYFTLRGDVVVNRTLYRVEGERNGATVVPVDLRAGIVDGAYTPAAAAAFARVAQAVPSREAEELCRPLGVLPYSRSTHLRVGDAMGAKWEAIRGRVEPSLVELMQLPEDAVAVSVSVDRTSLAMREPRPLTPEDEEAGVRKPISVVYRMAFTAVVTLYDKDGDPLTAIRYAHVPTGGAAAIEKSLRNDVSTLLKRRPGLLVVALSDGAPEMERILARVTHGKPLAAQLTDLWHLAEKLGAAITSTGRYAKDLLGDWVSTLLDRDDAIEGIEEQLRSWKAVYEEEVPEALSDALTYIENRRERLRYATARRAGLPVGSGTVEATCKTIVGVRMKRAGSRWTEPGAQAILGLRALATSEPERWHRAISHVLASYRQDLRVLPAKPR